MHHDGNDNSSGDFTYSDLEAEFHAWRKSWLESLIDDYGMLARYRVANAGLEPPAPNENRVVFFGDSITEGWDLEECFPNKPYINRGICAQTTPQMLLRFRQDVIALRPTAVVIHAGTNDIGGNTGPMLIKDTEANYASMVEIAQANSIRVIVSSLLPAPHQETPPSRYSLFKHPPENILELNRWLKNYSVSQGCDFLDYFSAMSDAEGFIKRSLSEDGLHPTPAGYRAMAQIAGAGMEQALDS
jgi:lysophospholipase L1-like esterase